MIYEHRFSVAAPMEVVARFHSRSASLVRLTPPPIILRLTSGQQNDADGQVVRFALRVGPVSIPWVARISDVTPMEFTDVQTSGPFAAWTHRHRFVPLGDRATEVVDRVEAKLASDPVRFAIGAATWLSMPLLFAYRARATARAVKRRRESANPIGVRSTLAHIIRTLHILHPSPKGRQ
jgi:ligand-binding SRPBCC domain-containing protein